MQHITWSYIKEKWNHDGFQRYFKNTSWLFFTKIFILIVAFFVNAYMARYLGPSNFGLLNYIFSFVGIFGFLASLGVESIANREIIKDHTKKNLIIGTSFYLKIFGSILSIIVTTIISRFTTDDPILLGLIFIYSFSFIFSAFNIIDYYFQSQVLSKYPAMVTIAVGIISAILKVIAMTFGLGIIWLTAIYILESILTALGLIFFFIFKGHSIKEWIFDKKTALIILKDSWPLMISMVAWSIYMKIDQVMIKNMIGNEQNGIYAVAAKLAEFWYFIPGMICTSILPAIINAKKTSKELYEKRLSKLYLLMFCLSLFVALFISFFAYYIIYIIFGNQYLEAVTTLRIYVWAGIAVSLGTALSYYLIIENMTKITAIATVIGAVVNVILNFILIPRYGINGAAIASVVSYMIVTLSMLSFLKQKIINLIK